MSDAPDERDRVPQLREAQLEDFGGKIEGYKEDASVSETLEQ
jgi:hypothetical protein